MTDEQIVKALGQCSIYEFDGKQESCKDCPFNGCDYCKYELCDFALDLIKRQQAEIEKLNKVKVFNFTVSDTKEIMPILFCHEKELKNEAVKEFAERLTNIICEKIVKSIDNPNGYDYFITDVSTDIDNLVKEMTEKEGGKG
jgi:hypothetical protein